MCDVHVSSINVKQKKINLFFSYHVDHRLKFGYRSISCTFRNNWLTMYLKQFVWDFVWDQRKCSSNKSFKYQKILRTLILRSENNANRFNDVRSPEKNWSIHTHKNIGEIFLRLDFYLDVYQNIKMPIYGNVFFCEKKIELFTFSSYNKLNKMN